MDLYQLPSETVAGLRDTLLSLLAQFEAGPQPVRTQLCISLVYLAIHMTEWKDALQQVVETLGNGSQSVRSLLGFIQILPEEFNKRKINMTVRSIDLPLLGHVSPPARVEILI